MSAATSALDFRVVRLSLVVYDTDFIGIATKTGSLVVQGVQHDEVQILAVELVFRIHLLVMSLKGKATRRR